MNGDYHPEGRTVTFSTGIVAGAVQATVGSLYPAIPAVRGRKDD